MSGTNGGGKSRLDRIEELIERRERAIERQELANEAAHELFKEEDKRLLTAQILMNSAMQRMANAMAVLEVKMAETTDKLNALIATVDGLIPRRGPILE